jgi:hypothetical protein
MESRTDFAGARWNPPECPFTVEYSFRVMDDIRLAVVDAFFSLPRGGAEIGGILLGNHDAACVAITGYLALDCEHAFGPSFHLSARDLDRLAALIESARRTKESQPVGWYHSHTRSEIFLSDADQEIHNRFFPEPWQVAMVLRPHTFQPARAGFFFREADGSIHATASYQEVVLEALPMKLAPTGPPAAPAKTQRDLRRESVQAPAGPILTLTAEPERRSPEQQALPLVEAAGSTQVEPEAPRAAEPAVAGYQEPRIKPVGWGLIAVVALAVALASAAFVYQSRKIWVPRLLPSMTPAAQLAPVSLGLFMSDREGELQIRWNHDSPVLRNAVAGVLIVNNGGPSPQEIRLDAPHIRSGAYTVVRQSAKVDATLSIDLPDGRQMHEATAFLGKLPANGEASADPAVVKERDSLALRLDRANQALRTETERNKRLQRSVDQLRKQLVEQVRKRMDNQVK